MLTKRKSRTMKPTATRCGILPGTGDSLHYLSARIESEIAELDGEGANCFGGTQYNGIGLVTVTVWYTPDSA